MIITGFHLDPMHLCGSIECQQKGLFAAILTIKQLNYMQFPQKINNGEKRSSPWPLVAAYFMKQRLTKFVLSCRNIQSILKSPELDTKYSKFASVNNAQEGGKSGSSPKSGRRKFPLSRNGVHKRNRQRKSPSKVATLVIAF